MVNGRLSPSESRQRLLERVGELQTKLDRTRELYTDGDYLNAWCELSGEDMRGRCPRTRVGLLTNP